MYKCVEWGKKRHYAHAGGAKHACPSLDAEGKKEGRKEGMVHVGWKERNELRTHASGL